MKILKLTIVMLFVAALVLPSVFKRIANGQTESPSLAPETTLTEEESAKLAASTDQANKVSGNDTAAANDTVDAEGVAPGTTDTFSLDPDKDPAAVGAMAKEASADRYCPPTPFTKAPADFDNQTNGFIPQGTPVPVGELDPTPGTFEANKFIFSGVDEIEDGLGPVYNAQSCRECHQNPVTGAISQITELRAGHNLYCDAYNVCSPNPCTPGPNCTIKFVDAPGGSLINDRSIPTANTNTPPFFGAKLQERVPPLYTAGIVGGGGPITGQEKVRTFRTSLNTLGDGFVEAISNQTLLNIAAHQVNVTGGQVHGQAIRVPILESSGCNPNNPPTCRKRIGRFGWKDQHASLLSFSSDAYLNEMGITNFLTLAENSSLGRSVAAFDSVPDNTPCDDGTGICGEDPEKDIVAFAQFMRATKAPPQDPDIQQQFQADILAGKNLFRNMPGANFSCSMCHTPKIVTAPPCTPINGGTFHVPVALGNKIIMPFSDFLLHDVGTGDGIVQNGGQKTRNKVRTPPLWGVRTRDRLMHDGEALTFIDAIKLHSGEAQPVITAFNLTLNNQQRRQLIMYLESL